MIGHPIERPEGASLPSVPAFHATRPLPPWRMPRTSIWQFPGTTSRVNKDKRRSLKTIILSVTPISIYSSWCAASAHSSHMTGLGSLLSGEAFCASPIFFCRWPIYCDSNRRWTQAFRNRLHDSLLRSWTFNFPRTLTFQRHLLSIFNFLCSPPILSFWLDVRFCIFLLLIAHVCTLQSPIVPYLTPALHPGILLVSTDKPVRVSVCVCVCVSKCAIVIYLFVYTLMCVNSWRFAEAASGRLEHFLWSTAFQSIVRRVDLIDNDGDDEIFDRCPLDWFVLPCLSPHWLLLYHLTINLRHNTKEETNKNPCRSTKQRRQTCLLTMTLYI